MKGKRGRPKGKAYPQPHTIAEAFDTAIYGKLGASEAMALLRDSPFPTLDYIKRKPAKKRDRVDKEYLRRAPEFIEKWARHAGRILCNKIALGDVTFFRELAHAVDEFCKETRPIESFRRYVAIEYKLRTSPIWRLLPKDSGIITGAAILVILSTPAHCPK